MKFAMILDLIILVIVGLTVYKIIKNGFIKTALNAISLVASAILAIFISPAVGGIFNFSGENSAVATYLIVFAVLWIIIKVLSTVLDKTISKIPILGTINKIGGIILGTLLGLFRICAFCTCVDGIIKIGSILKIDFISNIDVGETILFGFFNKINIIKIILELIF